MFRTRPGVSHGLTRDAVVDVPEHLGDLLDGGDLVARRQPVAQPLGAVSSG